MLKGIKGCPYIDLSNVIDHSLFLKLHPAICRGIALGSNDAYFGGLEDASGAMNLSPYKDQFKPLHKAYEYFLNLPDTDPIKSNGIVFKNHNDMSTYLKFALGGYDLYSFHILVDFENGWRDTTKLIGERPSAKYFPEVMEWIQSLVEQKVFSHIGRATFFIQEAGGISFEHRDDALDPEFPEITSEFIHIRPHTHRPFYIKDTATDKKTYIDASVAYWNDQDCHGGDPVTEPTYTFRIDGSFTEEFKNKIHYGK